MVWPHLNIVHQPVPRFANVPWNSSLVAVGYRRRWSRVRARRVVAVEVARTVNDLSLVEGLASFGCRVSGCKLIDVEPALPFFGVAVGLLRGILCTVSAHDSIRIVEGIDGVVVSIAAHDSIRLPCELEVNSSHCVLANLDEQEWRACNHRLKHRDDHNHDEDSKDSNLESPRFFRLLLDQILCDDCKGVPDVPVAVLLLDLLYELCPLEFEGLAQSGQVIPAPTKLALARHVPIAILYLVNHVKPGVFSCFKGLFEGYSLLALSLSREALRRVHLALKAPSIHTNWPSHSTRSACWTACALWW